MARRKNNEEEIIDDNSRIEVNEQFLQDLIKDTDIILAKDSSSMNSELRPKIKHPLWVLNCLLGGGLPMTLQTEFCGPPSSGKTTGAYTMLGNFLRNNPDGVAIIIDTEGSMDTDRLTILGVDVSRVLRLPASSIENGFGTMFKMFVKLTEARKRNPNITVMVVFDSVSSGGTNKQHDTAENGNSVLNAGAMMELPRILKQNTANVFPFIEKLPILVVYINQVSTVGIGTYAPKLDSIGGNGFKHNMQFSLMYSAPKDVYEDGFVTGSECTVNVKKSKISPKFIDIPCVVNANGGVIDEVDSFFRYLAYGNVGIIKTGAYYSICDTIDLMIEKYPILKDNPDLMKYYKSIRKNDLYQMLKNDKDLQNFLQIRLIDFIDDKFPMQRDINGSYQKELMKECSYFNKLDIETGEILEDVNNESEDSQNGESIQEICEEVQ